MPGARNSGMWNTAGNMRACSRPDSRKRRWSRRCLKTGSGGSPSVSRSQTASNTGSPGFTGAARCRGAEALFLSGERLGGILCKGPAPRLAAGAQHLRLADLVSGRGAAVRGERGRHAAGAFISDGAVGSVAGMPAVQRGLPALQTRDLCRQARLAGINYTCEAGEKSHELQDHR